MGVFYTAWVDVCTGARVHGCTGAWVHGCMGARVHGCMGAWVHGCTSAWVHGCTGAWVLDRHQGRLGAALCGTVVARDDAWMGPTARASVPRMALGMGADRPRSVHPCINAAPIAHLHPRIPPPPNQPSPHPASLPHPSNLRRWGFLYQDYDDSNYAWWVQKLKP
jgi:hypothetical protein